MKPVSFFVALNIPSRKKRYPNSLLMSSHILKKRAIFKNFVSFRNGFGKTGKKNRYMTF